MSDDTQRVATADRNRSQIKEVINRNIVASLALAQGFNVFLPVYDSGIDFILYRESDGEVRKVQLKSRWTIATKYEGREIWIAFPIAARCDVRNPEISMAE